MTAIQYFTDRINAALPGFVIKHGNGMEFDQFTAAAGTEPNAVFISWSGFNSGTTARDFSRTRETYTLTIRTVKTGDIRACAIELFNEVHQANGGQNRYFKDGTGYPKAVSLEAGIAEYSDYQKIEISAEVA